MAALRREPVVATGGDGESIIDRMVMPYRVHTFTTSDDFVVSRGGEVEYLIVAGGGGGGRRCASVVVALADCWRARHRVVGSMCRMRCRWVMAARVGRLEQKASLRRGSCYCQGWWW